MADNTKPRQDENVDFWMSKKPEKMLKQYRVTSTSWIKKGGIEVAIC
jgi:hypothetical protein